MEVSRPWCREYLLDSRVGICNVTRLKYLNRADVGRVLCFWVRKDPENDSEQANRKWVRLQNRGMLNFCFYLVEGC